MKEIEAVPELMFCHVRGEKEGLEEIIRKTGLNISFQWPQEMVEFVEGVREKVNKMSRSG